MHLLMQRLEDNEESGYNKEQSECTYRHSCGNAKSEYTVSVGTGTTGDNQRNHTGNHRHNGHQDRTQTFVASRKSGIADRHTLRATFLSELGDKDSRLGKQTDKHDHTRLQVDIILHARQV